MFKAKRTQTIQVVVPATVTGANSDVAFENQPQLQSISGGRQVFVEAIEVYTDQDLVLSPFTSNLPVATADQVRNATLTISVDTNDNFKDLPLSSLHRLQAQGVGGTASNARELFLLNSVWQIDWSKSYITCVGAPSGQPFCYLFNVYYRYSTDVEAVEAGALQTEILLLNSKLKSLSDAVYGR